VWLRSYVLSVSKWTQCVKLDTVAQLFVYTRWTPLCSRCYKARMAHSAPRARVAVYFTPFELSAIKKQAGDVPLSKWCKKKMLESMVVPSSTKMPSSTNVPKDTRDTVNRTSDLQPDLAIREDVGRESLPSVPTLPSKSAKSPARTCVHGTAQGYRCWQCGGKAKMNE